MADPPGARRRDRNLMLAPAAGILALPLWWVAGALLPPPFPAWAIAAAAVVAAPLPTLWVFSRRLRKTESERRRFEEEAQVAQRLCQAMEHRAQRLREDLTAANEQARLAHQLTLLGQFVAGFLHEVNNPLSIMTGRLEALLEERGDDAPLCADLSEILREARYVGSIASTLLPALRKVQVESSFEPAAPAEVLAETVQVLRPVADAQGVELHWQAGDSPRVNLPAHIVDEVARALVTNAVQALGPAGGGNVWVRLCPLSPGRTMVRLEIEDDGPGVPEALRPHIFEPFVSARGGKHRSGLGLFIVASLLSIFEGSVSHEPAPRGGARFVVEMPRARFTKDEPYHWFTAEAVEGPEAGS